MRYTLLLTIELPEDVTIEAFQQQIDAVAVCLRGHEFVQDVLLTELPDDGDGRADASAESVLRRT